MATKAKKKLDERALDWPMTSYNSICVIPSETEAGQDKIEAACHHWMDQLDQAKWPRAMSWFNNESFYHGNHTAAIRWNGTTLDFNTPRIQAARSRMDAMLPRTVDNRLIRPVEQSTGMLTERRSYPRVLPNSDQPDDEDAAEIAEIALDLYWEQILKMPEQERQLALVLAIQGTAVLEVTTEETDQVVMVPPTAIESTTSDLTGEVYQMLRKQQGDYVAENKTELVVKLHDAYSIQPDPGAIADNNSLTWFCRQSFEDIDWVKDEYGDEDAEGFFPKRLDHIQQEVGTRSPLYWRDRVRDILDTPETNFGLTSLPYSSQGQYAPNQCILRVFDCKPNKYNPRGRTLITAGKALIYAGDARAWSEKYPHRWHPHAIFRYWQSANRWWGMPLLSQLIPLQKRINAIDALTSINRQFMTIGQWMVPRQSKVADGMLSGLGGQEIKYSASSTGAKPEKVRHEPLPPELFGERAECARSIDLLASSSMLGDKSLGSGTRAASMLEFFRKERMAAKSSFLQDYERGIETVSQNVLMELSIHMSSPDSEITRRIQAAAKDSSSLAIAAFTGASLRDHVNVKIDIASQMMRSPEAEVERAMQFMQFNPNMSASERAIIAKKIGLDGFDRQNTPHYRRARKMVARILQGQGEFAVPLPAVDDPAIFAEVFRDALLSDRLYELDEKTGSLLYGLFDFYRKVLMQKQQEAMMAQAQMAQLMGGSGAPGGGGQETTAA